MSYWRWQKVIEKYQNFEVLIKLDLKIFFKPTELVVAILS